MSKDVEKVRRRIRKITPSKNNPMYNSHMYWSQKPYNICDILIEELSEKGDIVFDPFMGSGVTILEAVKSSSKRAAIGCEINEAPLSIVKTLLKKYDLKEYKTISEEIISRIQRLNKYYETTCNVCGTVSTISTVLFDLENRDAVPVIKEIRYVCPKCKRQIKTADKSDFDKQNRPYKIRNIKKFQLKENSKLAVYKGETIDQIFTKRNYKVLDEIVGIINEYENYKDVLNYILMSILHLCKITDTHSNSQWPLWIPKKDCIEKNVVDILCKKIKKFEDTIVYLNREYRESTNVKLLHKGSQHITADDIDDESISLIITDPPYLGQVAYSEYMQLYKPFINMEFNLKDEIIVTTTPDRKISNEEYFSLLDSVFEICDKKMKMGGFFCMYFHDSNLNVWNELIKSMADHHFKYLCQEHINKTVTLKNIISPKKSLSGDALLFFEKQRFRYKDVDPSETIDEIERNVISEITKTVKIKGALSTPELYDGGLIEYLVYNGWLGEMAKKYKTLVELFEKCLDWDVDSNKWKSREDAKCSKKESL